MTPPPSPEGDGSRQDPAQRADGGRLLLVGARRRVRCLARCLDQGPWAGAAVVGFVDLSGRNRQLVVHPGSAPVPILGSVDRLAELVDRSKATDLVVALSGRPEHRLRPQLAGLTGSAASVRVHFVPEETTRSETPHSSGTPHPNWSPHRPPWPLFWARLAKRLLDIVGALLGLIVLGPLFLGVSLAILLTTGRPIFYQQERVGQGGRLFRMWKFRSMRTDAEAQTGPIWASEGDARCTKIGLWLRKTNIDELPQLWNVLWGEMSLVGPRPERPVFVEKFRVDEPDYDYRHAVPVGMTGWAQVHGWRGRTSLRKRIQYDLDYIGRWSFWLDLRVLVMTVEHVFWHRTTWGNAGRRPEP